MASWDEDLGSDGRTIRRIALALTVVALTLMAASFTLGSTPANSHLPYTKGEKLTRAELHKRQGRNLRHAWYVCQQGAGQHKRWACKAANGWLKREYRETLPPVVLDPVQAIYSVFGSAGAEAVRVFRCESGLSIYANNNNTYLGIAQMGPYARSRYGHSSTLLGQLQAAHRYYLEAGWSPWECAYIVGVL